MDFSSLKGNSSLGFILVVEFCSGTCSLGMAAPVELLKESVEIDISDVDARLYSADQRERAWRAREVVFDFFLHFVPLFPALHIDIEIGKFFKVDSTVSVAIYRTYELIKLILVYVC